MEETHSWTKTTCRQVCTWSKQGYISNSVKPLCCSTSTYSFPKTGKQCGSDVDHHCQQFAPINISCFSQCKVWTEKNNNSWNIKIQSVEQNSIATKQFNSSKLQPVVTCSTNLTGWTVGSLWSGWFAKLREGPGINCNYTQHTTAKEIWKQFCV